MNRNRILAFSFTGILAACSTSSTPSGDAPIPITEVEASVIAAQCHAVFSCDLPSDDVRVIRAFAGDEAGCAQIFAREAGGDISDQLDRVAAGELVYDAAKARECLNSFGCNLFSGGGEPPVCRQVFQGVIAAGGACSDHADCAGIDTHCEAETAHTCPGECAAAVAQGGTCYGDRDCSTLGATISPVCDTTGSTDGSGTCKTAATSTVGSGAPCGNLSAATTVTTAICASGFFCDRTGSTDGTGTCAAVLASGATCERTEQCPGQEICSGGTCRVPPIAQNAGDACANSDEGPYCNPFHRLRCGASNTCEAVPGTGVVGDECTEGDFSIACLEGNYCDNETHRCLARKAAGQSCSRSDECVSDYCDGSSGTSVCAEAPVNECRI